MSTKCERVSMAEELARCDLKTLPQRYSSDEGLNRAAINFSLG